MGMEQALVFLRTWVLATALHGTFSLRVVLTDLLSLRLWGWWAQAHLKNLVSGCVSASSWASTFLSSRTQLCRVPSRCSLNPDLLPMDKNPS